MVVGNFDRLLKLLMIGDSGVGKTCLTLRYSQDHFSPTHVSTHGIDFRLKQLELNGQRVKVQIWDTAGQEKFQSITVNYFRGAQGIVLVYDILDRKSFTNIHNWIHQIRLYAPPTVQLLLVGNKCDQETKREISLEEGQALAGQYQIDFFEVSAKTDFNVNEAYDTIVRKVLEVVNAQEEKNQLSMLKGFEIKNASTRVKERRKCC